MGLLEKWEMFKARRKIQREQAEKTGKSEEAKKEQQKILQKQKELIKNKQRMSFEEQRAEIKNLQKRGANPIQKLASGISEEIEKSKGIFTKATEKEALESFRRQYTPVEWYTELKTQTLAKAMQFIEEKGVERFLEVGFKGIRKDFENLLGSRRVFEENKDEINNYIATMGYRLFEHSPNAFERFMGGSANAKEFYKWQSGDPMEFQKTYYEIQERMENLHGEAGSAEEAAA